jgi:hypothetical protein
LPKNGGARPPTGRRHRYRCDEHGNDDDDGDDDCAAVRREMTREGALRTTNQCHVDETVPARASHLPGFSLVNRRSGLLRLPVERMFVLEPDA